MRQGAIWLLAWLPFLFSCAGYQPTPLEITNPTLYAADVDFCQKAAVAYQPTFDIASVAYGTISGAADNAAGAALNPLVPVAGAAGGAVSAASAGLNITGQARGNVMKHCILERTHRDRSALIADPD